MVARLLGHRAEGVHSDQVGRVAVHVTAVGGATDRRVTRHTAETAGDVDGAVAECVTECLKFPHTTQRVGAGGRRSDTSSAPVAVATVHFAVGEVDRGVVAALQGVDLAEGLRTGDTVGTESVGLLEACDGSPGVRAERTVNGEDRVVAGVAGDSDLQLSDVTAAHAFTQGARPTVSSLGGAGCETDNGCGGGNGHGGAKKRSS